jgi:hypothetical protein
MERMTLDSFMENTVAFLAEHGAEDYLPTILPVGQPGKPLMLIRGIPEQIDHRDALQQVIRDTGLLAGEFFFCVRSGADELVGGRYTPRATEFFAIRQSGGKFFAGRIPGCEWWRLSPGGAPGPPGLNRRAWPWRRFLREQ